CVVQVSCNAHHVTASADEVGHEFTPVLGSCITDVMTVPRVNSPFIYSFLEGIAPEAVSCKFPLSLRRQAVARKKDAILLADTRMKLINSLPGDTFILA